MLRYSDVNMRNANPELISSIKKKTLELLMQKEPVEIGILERRSIDLLLFFTNNSQN